MNDRLNVGEHTYGHENITIRHWGEDANVYIGKFCSIADQITIFLGGNHRVDWVTTFPFTVLKEDWPDTPNIAGHPATKGDVIIGNDVWIGSHATIMSGVTIGNGSVIGAYSVVTKDVKPYEIVAGNPAKHIKNRFEDKQITGLQEIKWWDWDKAEISRYTNLLCSNEVEEFIKKAKETSYESK